MGRTQKILQMLFGSREHSHGVLGMNQRNLHYIYPHNKRRDFPLSDDKLLAKKVLSAVGVPVPKTYQAYGYFFELRNLKEDLEKFPDFVIKPARGRGGGGILVIAKQDGDDWLTVGGRRLSLGEIRKHISDIIFGVHSFGLADVAIIEERIKPHPEMERISPYGLADVRLILCQDTPIMAMSRIPTLASDGKANLHQGALGVGIDLISGRTVHAILEGGDASHHPDTNVSLVDVQIPHWTRLMEVGQLVARSVPLKYLGVDLVLTHDGPLVLEINVRPGLQIQNANQMGMHEQLIQASAGASGDAMNEPMNEASR